MGTVISLDDNRPHIVIQGIKSVHVVPLSVFKRIETGEIDLNDVDDIGDFIPTVIGEWLNNLQKNNN